MKSIMTSVSPYLCGKIASGQCKILVRKSAPKETPFKCYIYCCKDNAQEIVLLKDYKNRFSFGDYRNADGHFYDVANRTVIGEFICNKVDEYKYDYGCGYYPGDGVDIDDDTILETAIDREDINIYAKGKTLYGWHISDLKIYDKPKELSEFKKPCPTKEKGDCLACDCLADNDYGGICTNFVTRPPQSYMFVEEI